MDFFFDDEVVSVSPNKTIREIYEIFNKDRDMNRFLFMYRLKHDVVLYEDLEQNISETPLCDGDRLSFERMRTEENWEDLVRVGRDGLSLKYVQDQKEDICMAAVRHKGLALKYVKEQTEDICLTAIKQNGWAVEYVEEQTEKICLAAVRKKGHYLRFIKKQTPKICLEAVRNYDNNQTYVDKNDWTCIQYVKNETLRSILHGLRGTRMLEKVDEISVERFSETSQNSKRQNSTY